MMNSARARLVRWGLGLLVAAIVAGCAADRELAIIRNDLERLNRQVLKMQVDQEVSHTQPRELVQSELEGERRNIADMKASLDELRQQVGVLHERLEESGHRLNQRISGLESRLPGGAVPAAPAPGQAPPSIGAGPQPASPPPPGGQSPAGTLPPAAEGPGAAEARGLFQAALTDYQRGRFDLAVQGFQGYLQQAPGGDVADTAQYYLAESLYSAKDYHQAIAEFERLVRDYPRSPQVPSALLKTGYAYYEMRDGMQGRRALRTLIEKYPVSREAKLAEERLRLEERRGEGRPAGGGSPGSSSPPSSSQPR